MEKTPEQLDLEDFDLQVAMARRSLVNKHYALARAELRGAMFAIDTAVWLGAVDCLVDEELSV